MANETTHPELFIKQIRTLRDRSGMDRVTTMPKLYWDSFDFIVSETRLTESDLLAIADEEATFHGMTWHEYLPEGLAHIHHYYDERPELWKSTEERVINIGPSSQIQIDALEAQKTTE